MIELMRRSKRSSPASLHAILLTGAPGAPRSQGRLGRFRQTGRVPGPNATHPGTPLIGAADTQPMCVNATD
jgi:hypothetical protein